MATEAIKLSEAMEACINSEYKCKRCGYRPKHKDKQRCKRCIDAYYRAERLKPEQAEKEIERLVGTLYLGARFENLDKELQTKINNLKMTDDIFMFGAPGVGKTYTMAVLIRRFIYEGYECERINFDDFCVKVRATMSPISKQTEWDLIAPLKTIDKLFIDDLGLRAGEETQFTYQTFYSILNKRQENMLPTYISSNKNLKQVEASFDYRITSRLQTAKIIELKGKDRRIAAG